MKYGTHDRKWDPRQPLDDPLSWKKSGVVLLTSDLFEMDFKAIDRLMAAMALTPSMKYLVSTQWAGTMDEYLARGYLPIVDAMRAAGLNRHPNAKPRSIWPLQNVILGVEIRDQHDVHQRIPRLLKSPSAVKWLNCRLREPIDLLQVEAGILAPHNPKHRIDVLRGGTWNLPSGFLPPGPDFTSHSDLPGTIDWVTCEGVLAPLHPHWVTMLGDQCREARKPFYFHGWGKWKPISEMPSAEHEALYESKRMARDGQRQDEIDDVHGKRCIVDTSIIRFDGRIFKITDSGAFEAVDGHCAFQSFLVGKKKAGRVIDGGLSIRLPEILRPSPVEESA